MKVPRTIEGRWWIFGTDKPEHYGALNYDPEKGLRLSVKVAQSLGFSEILKPIDDNAFPNVIQGRDSGDQPVTLFACGGPMWSISSGLASYDFHPLAALLGLL